MTFVTTSLAIAGIAAASIPILVHLLLRRRRLAAAALARQSRATMSPGLARRTSRLA